MRYIILIYVDSSGLLGVRLVEVRRLSVVVQSIAQSDSSNLLIATIPHLTQVAQKYAGRGVQFVGVTDEDRATVEPFVTKMGAKMDYTVAIDSTGSSQEYMSRYHVTGIPHAFIVDRKGKIVWHGHPMDAAFESTLDRVSAEAAPSSASASSSAPNVPLTEESIRKLSTADLQKLLAANNISTTGCLEKEDFIGRALNLVKK